MTKLLIVAGVALALYSCTDSAARANEEKMAKQNENIAVVEKYIQAVEIKDTKTITDLLSDDYIGYGTFSKGS